LFFFQAEDGIRDFHVTGVQTCALPISWRGDDGGAAGADPTPRDRFAPLVAAGAGPAGPGAASRSQRSGRLAGLVRRGVDGGSREIGRASCRERVSISAVARSVEKNNCV